MNNIPNHSSMQIITLDFETYYDQGYSLSKMTTEEYIRDDRFEVIGVSVKLNGDKTEWFSGTKEETGKWLQQFPWGESMLIAHNTLFDAAIFSWHFDIKPKALADTLSMARAIHGVEVGGSLAKLVEHYGLGVKGTEVIKALGKRRLDFTPEELHAYGQYCINDTNLTYALFGELVQGYPKKELRLIDLTLRMFTEPVLELDAFLLEKHLSEVRARKEALLAKLGGDPAEVKKNIMSNPKFAQMLLDRGVEPPMKISPTTGRETFAFSKTDEGLKELLEHEDVEVQTMVAVRLGVKSTIEETRTERFLGIADRGSLPIPLKYYAAHTGRWGGMDKVNMQNLPSRGENANTLKRAILAPPGHVIIDCDSSQIEARMLAWMAKQDDLVEVFEKNNEEVANGVPKDEMRYDPYKIMASIIYRKEMLSVTSHERFIGKTVILGCFGPDTRVLTNNGWKRIVDVQSTDMVWDGEEWVIHKGVIPQGEKEVITAQGVSATSDHEILTEHGWRVWSEVATNPTLFQSAISKGRLPWSGGNVTLNELVGLQDGTPSFDASVGGVDWLTGTTSKQSGLLDAIHVQKGPAVKRRKSIGVTRTLCRLMNTALDYLTGYQAALVGAITRRLGYIPATGGGVFLYTTHGALIERRFCSTSFRYRDGKTQVKNSIESTITKDTNRETLNSLPAKKTYKTGEPYKKCKERLMTYDIAFSGPRNRFTIATNVGPVIVHNCGYGLGHKKFHMFMKAANVKMSLDEARHIIDTYRFTYPMIPRLWEEGDRFLAAIIDGQTAPYGREGVVKLAFGMVHTPIGIPLKYHQLRRHTKPNGQPEFIYTSRTGVTSIWGGKLTENLIQHLARAVVGEQMLKISKKYRVVLTVHDAIACIAREEEAEEARKYVEECMRWVPEWAPGLPLNCESGMGVNYGEC